MRVVFSCFNLISKIFVDFEEISRFLKMSSVRMFFLRPTPILAAVRPHCLIASRSNQIGLTWNNCRTLSTLTTKKLYDYSQLSQNDQTVCKAREKLRFSRTLPKYILQRSSIFLYEACTDEIKLENFINELDLEDTFNSWFFVTKLHVWLIAARCMAEKDEGLLLRNQLIERMWEDCTARINKLAMMKTKLKKESLQTLHHQFNATLLALDEGILSDDIVLAGAIWRTVIGMRDEPDPIVMERLVNYIRQQTQHLAHLKSEPLLFKGEITWKPISPFVD